MPAFFKTKKFIALLVVIIAGAVLLNFSLFTQPKMREMNRKVIILGFDGMDPKLLEQYMAEGVLPHLKKLAEEGTFMPLGTTNPPESPVAWASFQTGVNPGAHNIYDFLTRSTETYLPNLGMVKQEPPKFLWKLIPVKPPLVEPLRKGTPFWVQAGNSGVRTTVLTVPLSFPPDDIRGGYMLAGLPLPDIRGTTGTFSYWASDLSDFELGEQQEMDGKISRLEFNGDTAKTVVLGPISPILREEQDELKGIPKDQRTIEQQARYEQLMESGYKDIKLDMTVQRTAGDVKINVGGSTIELKKREWSNWVPLAFKITPILRIHGMSQFYLIEDQPEVKLYMSPVNWDPRNPPLPITKPNGWSKELVKEVGIFRTVGWAEATWPLNADRIDEATFIKDAYVAMGDRMKIMESELAKKNWNLFVSVYETTDRFQHMLYRLIDPKHPYYDAELAAKYGNAIRDVYIHCDKIVAKAMEYVDSNTTLFVVSDHGFHSFRKQVNLNTWLVKNGYMHLYGMEDKTYTLNDLFDKGQFWVNTDWTKTKAYAMGLGQIYINLQGREKFGTVAPGEEYSNLQNELIAKLKDFKDPDTGETMILDVYKRDDIYHGDYIGNAPDLMVGFNEGYRVSWQTTLGGIPKDLVQDNMKKWSGDHCSYDYKITKGVLLANKKIASTDPRIVDIAPTVYKILDIPEVSNLDGKPLF